MPMTRTNATARTARTTQTTRMMPPEEENPDDDLIAYACPNCGAELTFHANDVDFDENTLCPNCHQPIFPEIDEDSEEETEE